MEFLRGEKRVVKVKKQGVGWCQVKAIHGDGLWKKQKNRREKA